MNRKSTEHLAISGLKWAAASKLIAQVFAWAVTIWVMRLLSPADYGLMAMAMVVVSLSMTIAELGLGASIVQAERLSDQELARVAGLVVLLNFGMGVAVASTAPAVAWAFDEPRLTLLTQTLSLQFLFSAVSAVPQSLMSRELEFRAKAAIDLAASLATSACTLALALTGHGVWSIVLGNLVGRALATLLFVVFGRNVWPVLRLRGITGFLRYGGTLTATRLGWEFIGQTDLIVASRLLPVSAIGAYSVAVHLATLPMQKIMSVVNQVAFSAVARLQHDIPRMRDGLLRAFCMASVISVPLLWGLCACAPEFVAIALGSKWTEAVLPLQLVSLIVPVRLVSVIMVTAVTAVGRVDLYFRNMVLGAFIFPAGFYFGAQWGVVGLAAAWPLVWLAIIGANLQRVCGTLGMTVIDVVRGVRAPVLAGLPMVAAIFLARLAVAGWADLPRLVLLVAVGAATYVGVLHRLDRALLREFWRVLR